jgi:hypothetical protein
MYSCCTCAKGVLHAILRCAEFTSETVANTIETKIRGRPHCRQSITTGITTNAAREFASRNSPPAFVDIGGKGVSRYPHERPDRKNVDQQAGLFGSSLEPAQPGLDGTSVCALDGPRSLPTRIFSALADNSFCRTEASWPVCARDMNGVGLHRAMTAMGLAYAVQVLPI